MLPLALSILPDQITFESQLDSAEPLALEAGAEAVTDFATLLYAGTTPAAPGLMQRGSELPLDGAELPDSGIGNLPDSADVAAGLIVPPQGEHIARDARPWPAAVPVAADAGSRNPVPVTGSPPGAPLEAAVLPARNAPSTQASVTLTDMGNEPGASQSGSDRRMLTGPLADPQLNVRYPAPDVATQALKTTPVTVAAPDMLDAETRPVSRRSQAPLPTAASQPDRTGLAPIDRAPGLATTMPAAEPVSALQVQPDTAELWAPQPEQLRPLQMRAAPGQGAAPMPGNSLASATIATPVQEPAWASQLGERVVLMTNNAMQRAEIKLSPAELGPLRIQIQVDDGAANVTFHAQHPITRDAIEQALPRLREMLHESGLNLNQANVADSGERGPRDGEREATDPGGTNPDLTADSHDELAADTGTMIEMRRTRPDSLLDTFV